MTRQGFWLALALAVPYVVYLNLSGQLLELLKVDAAIIPVALEYLRALSWGAPMICLMLLLRFYSEGSGHTRPTMYIGVLGALLNIPFNWVLMFGHLGFPALGARGCGYATSLVIALQTLAMFLYVKTHGHYREFRLFERWDGPNWGEIRQLLKVGLPISGTLFVEGSLFMAAALLIGRLGTVPAASHLVAINYSALVFMVPLGLASAVTTRVGNALGRGDPAAARHAGMVGLGIVTCTQAMSAAIMLLFPELIVSIYTREPVIVTLAAGLLFYAAIFQLSDGIQICSAAILRGYKDTLVPMWINVISYWLIGMTLGYHLTFSREMGPAGMWIGMIAGLTVGAVLLTSRFLFRSRVSAACAPGP